MNLTGGRFSQLFNEDVRNVGFTNDGTGVWIRVADLTSPASVSLVPAVAAGTAVPQHRGNGRLVARRFTTRLSRARAW